MRKKKRKLSKKQKAALAKGRRAAKAKRSGGGTTRRKGRKGKGRRRAAKTGSIRARSRGRSRRRSMTWLKVITPGLLTIELATLAIGADVVTEVVTDGEGIRFLDPVAPVFFAAALAHRSRDLVQAAYALELRALAQESFGTNAAGIPRESLEDMAVGLMKKLLGMFHRSKADDTDETGVEVEAGPAQIESPDDGDAYDPEQEDVTDTSAASSDTD